MSPLYDFAEIMTTTVPAMSASARKPSEDLEAVHVVHDDVADDDRRPVGARQVQPGRALPGGQDPEAATREDERQELEQRIIVVDEEQGAPPAAGETGLVIEAPRRGRGPGARYPDVPDRRAATLPRHSDVGH